MATTKKTMVTGIFRDHGKARNVYDWLLSAGYETSELNVLMSDHTRNKHYKRDGDEEPMKAGNQAVEGIAVGGAIGTALGASLAAIAAVGTVITLPLGSGLVLAGPIVMALAGGGAGAVAGGIVGGLVGLGMSESNAQAYERALREGGVILGVVPHSNKDRDRIIGYFEKQGGENICAC